MGAASLAMVAGCAVLKDEEERNTGNGVVYEWILKEVRYRDGRESFSPKRFKGQSRPQPHDALAGNQSIFSGRRFDAAVRATFEKSYRLALLNPSPPMSPVEIFGKVELDGTLR